MNQPFAKIAGAPISWGVCEVLGWGVQLSPERVLSEMGELGLSATEFGPEGFLPESPAEKATMLKQYGLTAVGGFVPIVLHRADHDPLPEIRRELAGYAAAGAEVLVLAAATGVDGYDVTRPELDDVGWAVLFHNLDRIREYAAEKGVKAALHAHVGTMVETKEDVDRVLVGSTIPFCLDTGHLLIGGTDPVAFAAANPERVAHTHLKDVDLGWAQKARSGELTYYEAVKKGLYRPLGQGDLDVRALVMSLMGSGYDGWFTLEQDNIVTEEPAPGEGPVVDARASVTFLRTVLDEVRSSRAPAGNLNSP
jgi:inosose dehydratase